MYTYTERDTHRHTGAQAHRHTGTDTDTHKHTHLDHPPHTSATQVLHHGNHAQRERAHNISGARRRRVATAAHAGRICECARAGAQTQMHVRVARHGEGEQDNAPAGALS